MNLPDHRLTFFSPVGSHHDGTVMAVAWSPDGQRLASGSLDNTIRVWDAASGRELARLEGHTESVERVAGSLGRRTASVWHRARGTTPFACGMRRLLSAM